MSIGLTMESSQKRLLTGLVVSDAMDKTVVVRVDRTYRHPRFGKIIRASKKFKVHDEQETARKGDIVEFYETRPFSKTKYMSLYRVVNSGATEQQ